MAQRYLFNGGEIVLREKGQIFDQKSGNKIEWGKGIVLLTGGKKIVLPSAFFEKIEELKADPTFAGFLDAIAEE